MGDLFDEFMKSSVGAQAETPGAVKNLFDDDMEELRRGRRTSRRPRRR